MGNKREELEVIVQQDTYELVAITETWRDDSCDCSAEMDGYKLFRRDRWGKRAGGVVLYGSALVTEDTEKSELLNALFASIISKLGGVADTPEGYSASPGKSRELRGNEPHEIQQGKCSILHPGSNNPMHQCRLTPRLICWKAALRRGTWEHWWMTS